MATVMKLDEVPARKVYEGNEECISRQFVQREGAVKNAKDFGVMVQDWKAGGVPHDKTLHYHEKQETLYYILSGKCIVNVEGKEHELGPDTAIWIAPLEKHGVTKVLEDMKMVEIVSNPDHRSDIIQSKHPWYEEYPDSQICSS